ncbi:MAG: hypothetical protein J2P37_11850 [Ktedonobacteraceae bacterium]|nr:hypothetical protein [Ktedonobacteraceae bacterium]MBO0790200.1 hypothetical protein [Ktedonobacteraceae bacterium]
MGKYRQWLHYRDMDQKLRAQLAALKKELTSLQEQTCHLEGEAFATPITSNPLVQALLATQHATPRPPTPPTDQAPPETPVSDIEPANQAPPETPAPDTQPTNQHAPSEILNWGSLPNFDSLEVDPSPDQPSPSATPRPVEDLLPSDLSSFIAAHEQQTLPQSQLPWWLRNVLQNNGEPIDQQSIRTNKLVERWIARWGKQTPLPPQLSPDQANNKEPKQHE